ncbi:metallo-beta-lactamase [Bacillus tropicus]|nr:metallo-beta-lactamase [Bacillus tropicus]MBG9876564.1 metallo-beta-lactamase [Bacillus tropicus]MBG9919517.1 metallo-beta-lactamase [Bacillus tropicus]MBG9940433.1 metallo-beta-lactamase [Bacillus tropicus]
MLFSLLYRKYTLNVNLNEMYVDALVFIKHLLSGMGEEK